MKQLTFDSCLLFFDDSNKDFETINLQINDTLIFSNEKFAAIETTEQHAIKLFVKKSKNLIIDTSIQFKDNYINMKNTDIHFNQSKQYKNIRLVILKTLNDFISARSQIRKVVTSKKSIRHSTSTLCIRCYYLSI